MLNKLKKMFKDEPKTKVPYNEQVYDLGDFVIFEVTDYEFDSKNRPLLKRTRYRAAAASGNDEGFRYLKHITTSKTDRNVESHRGYLHFGSSIGKWPEEWTKVKGVLITDTKSELIDLVSDFLINEKRERKRRWFLQDVKFNTSRHPIDALTVDVDNESHHD